MRPYLTALTALLGAMLLYQGLALRGIIAEDNVPLEPEAAALLIAASAAMWLAALTLRFHAGLAAVEMALAGVVVIAIAGPGYRYLLASGAVAVVLAVFAAVVAVAPSPGVGTGHRAARLAMAPGHDHRPQDSTLRDAGIDTASRDAAGVPPAQPSQPDVPDAQRALRRVADVRERQQAARRAWRGDPAPRPEVPSEVDAPTDVPGAIIGPDERASESSSGYSGEGG